MSALQSTGSKTFLGKLTEICFVTPDLYKTIDGLTSLGLGPFQVFSFNDKTVKDRKFGKAEGDFELLVAFYTHPVQDIVFEIMQPTGGVSLMSQYLETHSGQDGVQHVAFDLMNGDLEQRKQSMLERGFDVAMQGTWIGRKGECKFVFFDTLGKTGTTFETIEFSEDWEDPEFERYPRAPEGDRGGS